MPARRKTGVRRKRNIRGAGWLSDAFNSVKNAVTKIVPFVKQNQLLSKGLAYAGHPVLGGVAGKLGYGRKRRVGRPRQRGRGPISDLTGMFGLGRKRGNLKLVGMSPY